MRPARVAAATLLALAGLVLLLAAAAFAVSRTDWAARQAATRASAALGQPVILAGLAVGLLPSPSLELRGLQVGPEGATGPLVSLARGVVGLRWHELRQAPTVLESLELQDLVLRPRVDESGRDNWTALVDRLLEILGEGPSEFDIGRLTIEGGRVEYSDARRHRQLVFTPLALDAREVLPAQPFPLRLRLAGEASGHVFHAAIDADATLDPDRERYALQAASLRGWIGGGSFGTGGADLAGSFDRLGIDFAAETAGLEGLDFDALGLRGRARASVAALLDAPVVEFGVETEPFAPRAVANALGRPLPGTTDPAAFGQALLRAEGRLGADGLTLERIGGRLDETSFSGSLRLPAASAVPRLRLALDVLDLDRYLPPGSGEPASPAEALGALLEAVGALEVDAVVEVERATVSGAVARGLRVTVQPAAREASRP